MRREYTLPELAAAVGMTERNVRAYRSRGLIPPPRLRGRVGYYGLEHLTQLRLVQALTSRGLSLQVVGQLVERGLAQHELARLIKHDLPEGPPLPLSPPVIEELSRTDARLLDELVEAGVAGRGDEGPEADPALLALAFQLAAHRVPTTQVAGVMLAAARGAAAAEAGVREALRAAREAPPEELPEPPSPGDGDGQGDGEGDGNRDAAAEAVTVPASVVALELATTAFRIALESRLSAPGP
jgi:DNA-binding transcriptional MerR regulator